MITLEKIKIYNNFKGDIDKWIRIGSKIEKVQMEDEDWYVIDGLIQDIKLVKKNLTSNEFAEKLEIRIIDNCDTVETISQLNKLVNN